MAKQPKVNAGQKPVVTITSAYVVENGETRIVPPGTVINLDAEEAEDGLARGLYVKPGQYQAAASAAPKRPADPEAVIAAIVAQLRSWGDEEKANPENFTGSGRPSVAVLEKQLGYDITADERDTAFAQVEKTLV